MQTAHLKGSPEWGLKLELEGISFMPLAALVTEVLLNHVSALSMCGVLMITRRIQTNTCFVDRS